MKDRTAQTGAPRATRPLDRLVGRRRLAFQRALLAWYPSVARPLRIRTTRSPWPVLVAEVMAQQTQIARVDEAWSAFLERFPTPSVLAAASPADVLRAWGGLGYNRRAVNLQRSARDIVERHAGELPGEVETLQALPGVGPYTARAVASLAFGRPVAAVDTNVRRVLTRLVGAPLAPKELQALADGLVPDADPGTWTHATMELGATVCRPARPACPGCPVRRWCASAAPGALPDLRTVGRADTSDVPRAGRPLARTGPDDRMRDLPFEHTTRWLRGRIVAHLRSADDGEWVHLPDRLGSHGPEHIAAATATLQQEGLLERDPGGRVRLPSSAS
jgi:A/G-specific adenine glycosylase